MWMYVCTCMGTCVGTNVYASVRVFVFRKMTCYCVQHHQPDGRFPSSLIPFSSHSIFTYLTDDTFKSTSLTLSFLYPRGVVGTWVWRV
jgi:hypothetical protein